MVAVCSGPDSRVAASVMMLGSAGSMAVMGMWEKVQPSTRGIKLVNILAVSVNGLNGCLAWCARMIQIVTTKVQDKKSHGVRRCFTGV